MAFLCKPYGNHKENTYRNYTKEKGTGIKAYQYKLKNQWNTKEDSKRGKEGQKKYKNKTKQKTRNKLVIVNPSLSITTWTVNRLNSPIKRQRMVG